MKVLLGIGGSEDSLKALSRTINRVIRTDDDLTIAIVDNPDTTIGLDALENRVREELESVDATATIRRVSGEPASKLVEIAETEGFDAIAIGGGKQSPMGKITIGSISEYVILNANITVILVR